MVVVAGHSVVAPEDRERYLAQCAGVIEQARRAPGCPDFSLATDLPEPGRIVVFERCQDRVAVEASAAAAPARRRGPAVFAASLAEYDVAAVRPLT